MSSASRSFDQLADGRGLLARASLEMRAAWNSAAHLAQRAAHARAFVNQNPLPPQNPLSPADPRPWNAADDEEAAASRTKSSAKKASLTRTAAAAAAKKDKPRTFAAQVSEFLFGWLDTKVKVGTMSGPFLAVHSCVDNLELHQLLPSAWFGDVPAAHTT